ncbi:50S ribosomal protein L24 [Petroclostridium sp. X23]|uniref:50S ribosomal protein L24 n=1 Tax=Petroclostridium sp. X23 TaxID=3045146 RepID=UPI0024AD1258|nr:50S ribosomal protein L24 [Petroclostridium sp. X23]WHH61686.1 50S ribosomal protein L24 [Petroclostridium sp. X23]
MKKVHVKKDDTVLVLSGKDKGKKGKVLTVYPKEGKVIVEGVNMVTKHTKPRKQGQTGGIVHQEAPIYAAKVMHVCNKCAKTTRVARKILENGDKVRYCKHCGEVFND